MYIYKQVQYLNPDMGLSQAELGGHGTLKHLAPVLRLAEPRPYWDKPSPVPGSSRLVFKLIQRAARRS